jgi:hypothetical protein
LANVLRRRYAANQCRKTCLVTKELRTDSRYLLCLSKVHINHGHEFLTVSLITGETLFCDGRSQIGHPSPKPTQDTGPMVKVCF